MAPEINRGLYSINLPDNWEDQTIYTFKGPDDSGIQHNLVLIIDNEAGGVNLKTYAKLRLDSIKGTLPGFELLGEHEKALKSGYPAYEIVYKWAPADDTILFQKQVFTIIDGRAYNFTSSFSKKTIKTIGIQVDAIIDSFMPSTEKK